MSGSIPPKIIIIGGPTASGKTRFGIDLAKAVNGEIVGADSLQIYRHLDIGTAKPTASEQAEVRHHLVDIRDPDEKFNAALFKELADEAIADILQRKKVPIVIGGTGLYLRILVRGLFEAPDADEPLRERLNQEAQAYGIEHLYRRLQLVDPELAAKVELRDRSRIMRGLEIFEQTGIPLSQHQKAHDYSANSYLPLKIALTFPRQELYQRIEMRAKLMIEGGLLEEYERLLEMGYSPSLKPLCSLGYRQMGEHLVGRYSFEQAMQEIIKHTKRYAKRQTTWFRKEDDVHWVAMPIDDITPVVADVRRFLPGEPLALNWTSQPP